MVFSSSLLILLVGVSVSPAGVDGTEELEPTRARFFEDIFIIITVE
jgi:hypothetical protein